MPEYLVIGNSAGGIGAAEAIREVDSQGSLTIISDEPYPAYSRPLISEYLSGERRLDGMLYRPTDFYSRNHIELLSGVKAVGLDVEKHRVKLETGEEISWGRLLLATGGKPIVPPMEGLGKKDVFTFTTLNEAKRVDEALASAKRAVVIGGGLIGMSITEALVKRGVEVAVVELMDRVLSAILDEAGSRVVEGVITRKGVRLFLGKTVKVIKGQPWDDERVGAVSLSDGQLLPCDMVVVAIGVSPRTELVANTPIKLNRGIVVDDHMGTSCPDIYACGDVAEAHDFITGKSRLIPIWPNAYLGGRVAGYNMAGKAVKYPGGTTANSLKYFGLPIVTAGLVNPDGSQGYEVIGKSNGAGYKKLILKDERVVGMVFVGDIQRAGIIFGLMRDSVSTAGFKESLLVDDFGLSYLPQQLRQEKLGLPVEAGKGSR